MKAAPNGNKSQAAGTPPTVATTPAAEVLDKWAATVFDAGSYTPEEHARLAELVIGRRIPVLGEVTPDGRIVWYHGAPATRQAE